MLTIEEADASDVHGVLTEWTEIQTFPLKSYKEWRRGETAAYF
ncbi:hypothetical protein ACEQPO_27025 [Bacillus sp. SL00103]